MTEVPIDESIFYPTCTECHGVGRHLGSCSQYVPSGVFLIKAERDRQIADEEWTAAHDAGHKDGELAWAAVCYAADGGVFRVRIAGDRSSMNVVDPWPLDETWDKRTRALDGTLGRVGGKDRIRDLVKAGALVAAEIDRLMVLLQPPVPKEAESQQTPFPKPGDSLTEGAQ